MRMILVQRRSFCQRMRQMKIEVNGRRELTMHIEKKQQKKKIKRDGQG